MQQNITMKTKETRKATALQTKMHEEFLALLGRGRQIKARRQKEAEEWLAERRRRQQEVAHLGYYNYTKVFIGSASI